MENTSQKGFNQLPEVSNEAEVNEHACFNCNDKGCAACGETDPEMVVDKNGKTYLSGLPYRVSDTHFEHNGDIFTISREMKLPPPRTFPELKFINGEFVK